ncbi:MAG: hypothetical protein ACXABY_10630 [Candidatus Thorarchaeota archaeon]|jgi:hypothetical protein
MDFKTLQIHPASDEAGVEIGEVVHKLGGHIEYKPLCGMPMFLATFEDSIAAQKALTALEKLNCISQVGWMETA